MRRARGAPSRSIPSRGDGIDPRSLRSWSVRDERCTQRGPHPGRSSACARSAAAAAEALQRVRLGRRPRPSAALFVQTPGGLCKWARSSSKRRCRRANGAIAVQSRPSPSKRARAPSKPRSRRPNPRDRRPNRPLVVQTPAIVVQTARSPSKPSVRRPNRPLVVQTPAIVVQTPAIVVQTGVPAKKAAE
jgi:hypothetical protein